jgi:hypothetical protein
VALASGKSPFTVAGQRRLFTALPEHSTSVDSYGFVTGLGKAPAFGLEKFVAAPTAKRPEGEDTSKDGSLLTRGFENLV